MRRNALLTLTVDLVILALFATFISFYELEEGSFHPRDETTHVRVAQEMQQTGDLWNPKVFGKDYYNKPPFKMWLSLVPVKFFGPTNFAYRFLDALAGLLSTLLLYIFARTIYQSRTVGFVAAVSLITSRAYIFHHGVRTATQDSLVNFLNLLSIIIAWRLIGLLRRESAESGQTRKKVLFYAIAGGISVGFAVLTKNVVGYIPVFLIGVFLLLSGEIKGVWQRGKLPVFLVVALGLLIPALYVVPHCLESYGLCKVMFGDEVVDRATVGYHNQGQYLFYIKRLLVRNFESFAVAGPAPELLIPGFFLSLGFWLYRRERRYLLPLVWGVIPVIVFSLIPSRLQWYIVPAFPGLAILAGISFNIAKEQFIKRSSAWWRGAQEGSGSTIAFSLFFLFSCLGLATNIYSMVDRVQVRDTNLVLDLLTREILATPELRALKLLHYEEMDLARNERIYLHRIFNRQEFKNLTDLTQAVNGSDVGFVLVPAKDFEEIAKVRKISTYRFLAPEFNRKTWDVFISYSPKMRSLEQTTQSINLQDQTPLLYGWSGPQVVSGALVKQISGGEAAVILTTNHAHEVSLTTLKIVAAVTEQPENNLPSSAIVLINSKEVGLISVSGTRLKEYKLSVPAGTFKSGQSIIALRNSEGNPSPVVIKELSVSIESGPL
jgi:4-amino-4-deoxy-L-arabinose transferase-like glycosyltransferase